MHDSNWSIRLAAIGAIFALAITALGTGAYFGALYRPHNQQHQAVGGDTGTSEAGQDRGQSLGDIAGLPEPVERAIKNPPAENSQDREQRDLAAQEGMAIWAFWMAFAALGTMFITFGGTMLIWRQVSLTREAVKDTGNATKAMVRQNELTEAAQRPWLSLSTDYVGPIEVIQKNWHLDFSVSVTNTGNSPAVVASIHAEISQEVGGKIDLDGFERRAKTILRWQSLAFAPNQTVQHRTKILLDRLNLTDDGSYPNKALPTLLVGVAYQAPSGKQIYLTVIEVWPRIGSLIAGVQMEGLIPMKTFMR